MHIRADDPAAPSTAVVLCIPSPDLEEAFLRAYRRLDDDERSSMMYLGPEHPSSWPLDDFPAFLDHLLYTQDHPKAGWVRGRVYWAVEHGDVVGRIGVRLELNDDLRRINGHIGYITVPWARGRGVASAMLHQVLLLPDVQNLMPVLLTCDDGNDASERVIVKNGGVFESFVDMADGQSRKKRFWIGRHDRADDAGASAPLT